MEEFISGLLLHALATLPLGPRDHDSRVAYKLAQVFSGTHNVY